MSIPLADLLVGPRGRRLCLEFALVVGDQSIPTARLRMAVSQAAYNLDPGRGMSRMIIRSGSDVREESFPAPSAADVASAPSAVAMLLGDAVLPKPTERTLLLALGAAVNNARYWQQPDGEDVLSNTPEVRAALERVAAIIAGSPLTDRWVTPLDPYEQGAITFADTDGPYPQSVKPARQIVETWHVEQVEEETRAMLERPTDATTNWSGSWWSRPPHALTHTVPARIGQAPAGLGLVEDEMGWDSAMVEQIVAPAELTVYEITGPAAWAQLCSRYPMEATASRRHDWYRTTGRDGRWMIPDWARVQEDFDAVHLTIAGYLSAAGRAIPVEGDRYSVLAGWDPDQTYWLRDVSRDESTRQQWILDREAEDWVRAGEQS
ncbi:MAG: hypothetical protein JWQ43_4040 [Glaciihabitans sp.]|nr:hypothetical protein [Glaciihabitans sp.]